MSPRKSAKKAKGKSKPKAKAKPVKKAAAKKAASAAAKRVAPKKAAKKKAPPRSGKVVEREERALGITTPRTSGSLGSSLGRIRGSRGSEQKAERDFEMERITPRGLGAEAGGQSGSTQGLSEIADDDSESVEELEEEGQSFEAEVISGIEHADDDVEAGVPERRRKRAAAAGDEEAFGDADEDVDTGGES